MSLKVVIVASFLFLIVAANRQSGLRIRPAQDDEDVEAEWCIEDPFLTDRSFESCNFFYGCDEFNRWILFSCEEDRPIYDSLKFECVVDDENAFCHLDEFPAEPEVDGGECPLEGNELVFIPGEYCNEYFICINGQPRLMTCRDGEHWNDEMNYCDLPHSAGCDENAEKPVTVQDCATNLVESFPHPQNCNWFIHCRHGNRLIQQCPHMFHFDVDQNRCLFRSIAKCITD